MCSALDEVACGARDDCRRLEGVGVDQVASCWRGPHHVGCQSTEVPCTRGRTFALAPHGQCWTFEDGCVPTMFEALAPSDSRVTTHCQLGADAGLADCDDPAFSPCDGTAEIFTDHGCLACEDAHNGLYTGILTAIDKNNQCEHDEECIAAYPMLSCVGFCQRAIPATFEREFTNQMRLLSELICVENYSNLCRCDC